MEKTYTQKKQNVSCEGIVTITNLIPNDTPRAQELEKILSEANHMDPTEYQNILKEFRSLCTVSETRTFKNKVVLSGRKVIAQRLGGTLTYSGTINYGALGTGSAAVLDSDTVLDTEVKRKQVATIVITNDVVTLDFYFSKADTNGTYNEIGTFIDGTSTVDTGQMYNRALTGGWVKTSLEAMTMSIQFNVNSA